MFNGNELLRLGAVLFTGILIASWFNGPGVQSASTLAAVAAPTPEPRVETILWDRLWHSSAKDTMVDGAMRVSAVTYKDGRSLTLRCFKFRPDSQAGTLDLRFQINTPLLKTIASQMEKRRQNKVRLFISIDEIPLPPLVARISGNDSGMSVMADITGDVLDKFANAKERIVVVPRDGEKELDNMSEFGVRDVDKLVPPVKAACKSFRAQPNSAPMQVLQDGSKG